jgi:GT2 family glycosyltransferase
MASTELTVIIVSYNTKALLREALASVAQHAPRATEVIVVDNASADGSADMVAEEFPFATLVRSPRNLGFAAANNVALRRARGEFVMLLNPDAVLCPDTARSLMAFLRHETDVGIAGPTIFFPDGTFQSSGFPFPTVLDELRQSRSVDWLLRRCGSSPAPTAEGTTALDVDWVDGACLMIRREALDEIGLIDEQYFLYGEEVDWCYRARRAGWRVVAVRSATVKHHRGKSSGGAGATVAYLTETRLRFFRTHHGTATALLVSVIFALGCVRQMAGAALAALLRRRRSTAASWTRLKAVWHWWAGLFKNRRLTSSSARLAS